MLLQLHPTSHWFAVAVREFKANKKVLVTTLTSAKQAPKNALVDLYRQRWHIELDLRNIKTTLGMETLSCKTPQMNEKEMWIYFLAYNLIRLIMAEAALQANLLPCQLSFKHSLQISVIWSQQQFIRKRSVNHPLALIDRLLYLFSVDIER